MADDAGGSSRVRVFARIRPAATPETVFANAVDADADARRVHVRCDADAAERLLSGEGGDHFVPERRDFNFDGVFSPEASQREVFAEVGLPVLRECLQGFNGAILAYGQTGSGKTHSLLHQGRKGDEAGLLPRLVASLFVHISQDAAHVYQLEAAAVQVYNEQVDDLLHANHAQGGGQGLLVRDGGVVPGLTWLCCQTPEEMLEAFARARSSIVYAETKMNKASSRSHAVFQIRISRRCRTSPAAAVAEAADAAHSGGGFPVGGAPRRLECTHARLCVVDLAGSERVKKSGVEGVHFKEATAINRSLLAFGNVVSALAAKRPHVPFRDSKLTRILEGSVGGNCKTSLLVCASPVWEHAQETLSTLEFASRAMRVEVHATVNHSIVEVSAQALLEDLTGDAGQLGAVPLAPQLAELQRSSARAAEQALREATEAKSAEQSARQAEAEAARRCAAAEQEAKEARSAEELLRRGEEEARSRCASAEAEAKEARSAEELLRRGEEEAWSRCAAAEAEAREARSAEELFRRGEEEARSRCAAAEAEATEARHAVEIARRAEEDAKCRCAAAEAEAAEMRSAMASAQRAGEETERRRVAAKAEAAEARSAEASIRKAGEETERLRAAAEAEAAAARGAERAARYAEDEARGRCRAAEDEAARARSAAEEAKRRCAIVESEARETERSSALAAEISAKAAQESAERLVVAEAEAANARERAREAEAELEAMRQELARLKEEAMANQQQLQEAIVAAQELAHRKEEAATNQQKLREAARSAEERRRLEAAHSAALAAQRSALEARLRAASEDFEARLASVSARADAELAAMRARADAERGELHLQLERQEAARSIAQAKELELRKAHADLTQRVAARESRAEDLAELQTQRLQLEEKDRCLQARVREIEELRRKLENRDAVDRIFSVPEMRRSCFRAGSPSGCRKPLGPIPPLPGKKIGDLQPFGERDQERRRRSSSARRAEEVEKPQRGRPVLSPAAAGAALALAPSALAH